MVWTCTPMNWLRAMHDSLGALRIKRSKRPPELIGAANSYDLKRDGQGLPSNLDLAQEGIAGAWPLRIRRSAEENGRAGKMRMASFSSDRCLAASSGCSVWIPVTGGRGRLCA